MIAGTIGVFDAVDEPLESWSRGGTSPALDVRNTQTDLNHGAPVQTGVAAGEVETTDRTVAVSGTDITVDEYTTTTDIVTDWVADPTGAGVVLFERIGSDESFPFPFDLFTTCTGHEVRRVKVDVTALRDAWEREDRLADTWMVGSDTTGAVMQYHEAVEETHAPTTGLGFEVEYGGTILDGVVYASGYLAVYKNAPASVVMGFVTEDVLPETYHGDGGEQTTLGGGV